MVYEFHIDVKIHQEAIFNFVLHNIVQEHRPEI